MTIQEKVAAIERFPLRINTKIELLLVLTGHKKATTIFVYGKTVSFENADSPPASKLRIKTIQNFLSRLGLPYQILSADSIRNKDHDEKYERVLICIGHDDQSLHSIASMWQKLSKERYPLADKVHGNLSGFPKSAVRAYLQQDLMPFNEQQAHTKDLEYDHFCQFRFSKDHWQEELKTAERWAQEVKILSPQLYTKFITMTVK